MREAAEECRPDWSSDFVEWLVSLVILSLESSVGIFEGSWYKQKGGIPTGGSLCVQLANITVYWVMRKAVYENPELMKNIISVKRYIDDGADFIQGPPEDFHQWIRKVNENLSEYGLFIDESCVGTTNTFISFLDIQFAFDSNGDLQTDLYVKPTDSRAYLNFASAHPKHIFSGIVYSACFRLRRIINNQDRLKIRLDELRNCFKNAGYPDSLIDPSIRKALSSERSLERKSQKPVEDPHTTPSIRVVSTFGSDTDIVNSVSKFETALTRTRSFSESDVHINSQPRTSTPSRTHLSVPVSDLSSRRSRSRSSSLTLSTISTISTISSNANKSVKPKLFQFVKKTGACIRNRVVHLKSIALGHRSKPTEPCKGKNCKCCKLISNKDSLAFNNRTVKPAGGSCKSYNIIYLFVCNVCNKHYVGRSTRPLRTRVGEHRRNFYRMCDKSDFDYDRDSDEYTLGHHLLHDQNLNDRLDFDNSYSVCILDICSPRILDVKEHKYIHSLNSLTPSGLNLCNPFSVPLLYNNG